MISEILKNNSSKKLSTSAGFSLLELVLAVAIFSLSSFAMATMLIDSNISTRLNTERIEALFYAKEGIEAVRSIRDNSWDDFYVKPVGDYGLGIDSETNLWVLNGGPNSIGDNDKYTRTVNISTDAENENLKNVSVNVAWNLTPSRIASTTLSTVFSNWISVMNSGSLIPTDGLISYWSFDGNADDNFGSNNGTCVDSSCPTLTSGIKNVDNTAYSFDGNGDYIRVDGIDADSYSSGLSFGGWFKLSTVQNKHQRFFGWDYNGDWGATFVEYYNGVMGYRFGSGSSVGSHGFSYPLSSDVWYHVVVTHEPGFDKMYINGLSVNAVTGGTTLSGNVDYFKIGSGYDDSETSYTFGGVIDQVRIYSRALTGDEIQAIYDEEKPAE